MFRQTRCSIDPSRHAARWSAWVAAGVLFLAVPGSAPAQGDAGRRWTVASGAITYRVSDANGWGVGPELVIGRELSRTVGVQVGVFGLLSSNGFYDFGGLGIDLGPRVTARGDWADASVSVGASGLVGADSDGTGGAHVGGYAAARVTAWATRHVGLYVAGTARVLHLGTFSPSASAGATLRL